MKTDKVTVKKSKIEGKGVFAECDFRKGEVVLRWDTSRVLTEKEAGEIVDKEKKYVSFLEDKCVLMQSPEKYVNHSCEPNTAERNLCDVARRDIKKGEEITIGYGDKNPSNVGKECCCGSRKCKKVI